MSCGSWCVYFNGGKFSPHCDACLNLDLSDKIPRTMLGEINPFELARLLKNKKEHERRRKIYIVGLRVCPRCQAKSLFYNTGDDFFECLNLECKATILPSTKEYDVLVGGWWDKPILFPDEKYKEDK